LRRRTGPAAIVAGLAGDVAAAVRRRQRDREPRVVLYAASGAACRLPADHPAHPELVRAAEELLRART
jgi:hypothetical protein